LHDGLAFLQTPRTDEIAQRPWLPWAAGVFHTEKIMMNREQPKSLGEPRFGLTVSSPPLIVKVGSDPEKVTYADLVKHVERSNVDVSSRPMRVRVTGKGPSEVCGLDEGASRLIPLAPGDTLTMSSMTPGTLSLDVLIPGKT